MFLEFYHLRQQPFGVTPDPAYLYLSPTHREALDSLLSGIKEGRGFFALIAEPGMGKTTTLYQLLDELHDSARTVFLFQTQCNSREFFQYLLNELGVDTKGMDLVSMHGKLNEILFAEMIAGRRFVLIVDEAQNLEDSVLETVRLLSNFETSYAKMLQIVLAGQPQLSDKLAQPQLAQLRQRLAVRAQLDALSAGETANYVEHRLKIAGYSGAPLFSPEAMALIAKRSRGVPRAINHICYSALVTACSKGMETVPPEIVDETASRLGFEIAPEGPVPSIAAELVHSLSPAIVASVVAHADQLEVEPPEVDQPQVNQPELGQPETHPPETAPVALAETPAEDALQPCLQSSTPEVALPSAVAEPAQRSAFTLTYEPEKRFRFPRWASRALLVAGVLVLGGFSLTAFMLRLGVSEEEKTPKVSPSPQPLPRPVQPTRTTPSAVTPNTESEPAKAPLPAPLQIKTGSSANYTANPQDTAQGQVITVAAMPQQTVEDLSRIYVGYYDPELLAQIHALNPELPNPIQLQPGQLIRLPVPAGSFRKGKSFTPDE